MVPYCRLSECCGQLKLILPKFRPTVLKVTNCTPIIGIGTGYIRGKGVGKMLGFRGILARG